VGFLVFSVLLRTSINYRFHGKRKTLPLGVYPELSLKEAREKRDIAKKQIAEGIDPVVITKN
jgi:hypothetical protein